MNLKLISLLSTDKLKLPGLLYAPTRPSSKAAIWLHGMGDNGTFYNPERINALGEALTNRGITLLAFNNRGAHNSKKLEIINGSLPEEDRTYSGGTHYEKIVDCVKDIDGAVTFLKKRGFKELYLIGHSTGANKICAYNAQVSKTPFKKYVLAGPGDDVGLFNSELSDKKFKAALAYAKKALIYSRPYQLMPKYTGMYPFSAQAAVDILDPDGDYNTFPFFEVTTKRLGKKKLFGEYKGITIPLLVIFGENDEYAYTAGGTKNALSIFKQYTHPSVLDQSAFVLVSETDHGFHGREKEFATKIGDWLVSNNG